MRGAHDGQQVGSGVEQESRLPRAKQAYQLRYHFIRNCIEKGFIDADYINTKNQLADILMKALGRVKFHELRFRIGMIQVPSSKAHKV
jgi:hypothetical protein